LAPAKPFSPKEYPELKRHVEPWKTVHRIEGNPREIVNSIGAFPDNVVQLLKADLATVVLFPGTTSHKTTIVNGEHECIEKLFVPAVEGNVDENAFDSFGHASVSWRDG